MARSVRARIETRSARLRLPARKEPYWQQLEPGLSAGYYRPAGGGAGTWWGRVRRDGRYLIEALATADDYVAADGEQALSWAQAQAAIRTWAGQQQQDEPAPTEAAGPTVADAVEAYLADLRARKGDRPAHEARLTLNLHLLPALGDVRLADLTHAMFRTWRNSLVAESDDLERVRRSRDTANRILTNARAALNFARGIGLIDSAEAWAEVKPFRGVGVARKVILSDEEIQRLIEVCGPGLRELVALGAWTGARLGELTGARVRDFDPEAQTLVLDGKTGRREIFLPAAATSLLRRLVAGRLPDDCLLTGPSGAGWTESQHQRPFDAAAEAARLAPGACYYSLRHSFISRALKNLVPVKALADHSGTSMTMIEKSYAKFMVTDRQRYAEVAAPPLQVAA